MSGIYQYSTNDQAAINLGALTTPDAGSVNGQLATLRGLVDGLEATLGEAIASPSANTLQARIAALVAAQGAIADAQAANDTGSFSAIALLKLIAARTKANGDAALTSTATTTTRTIASAATAGDWGTAAGKGFRIAASASNAGKVLIRLGADPTPTLFSYEIFPGQTLFEDINYVGTIRALLPSGSAAHSANVTIFS